jgi:endonuclease/exonuclease/phosphatase family metal-dependent hydrolase
MKLVGESMAAAAGFQAGEERLELYVEVQPPMKLATFNVENLFDRPKAMNLPNTADGTPILRDYSRLNELIQRDKYTKAVKDDLLELMGRHPGLATSNKESKFMILRDIRGQLFRKPKNGPAEIVATGREDWIGWFELKTEPITARAVENTARIINIVNADVICIVEAEDRTGLKRFNETALPKVGGELYEHVMLIDGNDDRGIDVAIMCRQGFEIVRVVSHVDDTDDEGLIFSRDCAEYEIMTPDGGSLLVMVNHFKSKIGGGGDKRLRQAKRVRDVYVKRLEEGNQFIAIAGDLNEAPDQPSMDPLIRKGSTLTDIMVHENFVGDGRPGTHGNGTKSSKLDYILMSPKLSAKVTAGGIERRGVFGGVNGDLFPHLDEIEKATDAASDHAVLFVEFEL